MDVDVVEDDDERKPAKCAMESIIRSKRRGFLNNIVCVCVCVSLCTKNEGNEGRAEGSGKKVSSYKWNIYNRSFLLFAREEDGAIISLVKCKHD